VLSQQAKKKAAPSAGSAAPVEKYDLAKQIPVNLMKEGEEPVYKSDSEYPSWLWKITEEPPLVDDLLMRGVENLSLEELKRVARVSSKKRIRSMNIASEKQSSGD
jgi:predicted Rossmann fold nucleotide-binding protein DprA/Smf involved in DNA uptake